MIDFGTAKDLVETQYNGPEFVGTPDFMSPEALGGGTGMKSKPIRSSEEKEGEEKPETSPGDIDSDHTLDLWAFGAVAYQLLTGGTPFHSPSQYLAFLKIQRGLLCRPMGIPNDDAWDLISKLMKVNPKERLGADCFERVQYTNKDGEKSYRMVNKGNGYDVIRNHPYFADCKSCTTEEEMANPRPIVSLHDFCIRACGKLVQEDSTNIFIDKEHPPGDGSSHDMLRLNREDRSQVMDFLDKLRVLSQPRIYRRFFRTKQEARLGKVRQDTRDFVGLTQMNDKHYQFPMKDSDNNDEERSDVIETIFPIRYMHVSNPLFCKNINDACSEDERKVFITELKNCLKAVNRTRPKIVVASGYLDKECTRLMGKVNESIPVALNNGENFYAFWSRGGQGLVLSSKDFVNVDYETAQNCDQMEWLKQELEQSRMTKHHLFAFVDCDPNQLPPWLIRRLSKGRVMCLFGIAEGEAYVKEYEYSNTSTETKDEPNTSTETKDESSKGADDYDDDESLSSVESHVEEDINIMITIARSDSSLRCIQLEEYGAWEFEDIFH